MVTNLPEEAKAQWRKVSEAKTPEEKLRELQKFYSLVPKHKGTKNLLRQVRRQMAKLREEIEERKRKKVGTYISKWNKPKHGEGRIAIIGDDFLIISEAFNQLSHKDEEQNLTWQFEPSYSIIGDEHVQFQLVALPPLGISDSLDYKIFNFLKTVDFVFIVKSSEKEAVDFLKILYEKGVDLAPIKGSVEIIKTATGGIRIVGSLNISKVELEKLLRSYKIYHAIVKVDGEVSLSDIEEHILNLYIHRPGALLIIKECLEVFSIDSEFKLLRIGCLNKKELIEYLLNTLGLIRVFPRAHRDDVPEKPFVLKRGAKVIDLAEAIHKRLAKNFRYAIVVRDGEQIRVSKNFILEDMDIVEIRAY